MEPQACCEEVLEIQARRTASLGSSIPIMVLFVLQPMDTINVPPLFSFQHASLWNSFKRHGFSGRAGNALEPAPEDNSWVPRGVNQPVFGPSWSGAGDRGEELILKFFTMQGSLEVDYLLYKPSYYWSVAGIALLLDNSDDGFTYSGSWNLTNNATFPTGAAMKGTISQTRTKDSTFKAKFMVLHSLEMCEKLRAMSQSQEVKRTNWSLNRRLFGQSNLLRAGGDNVEGVLDATVTNTSGDQMLSLDYLTFTGSRWANVTSPASALVTPFPESGESGSRGSGKRSSISARIHLNGTSA
ncbi:hypothetical protein BKA70DRAFT_1234755 [Coprinopsis sp. MPI-PUGE-AT-0042]|nr:hypothetical protein BKA70DRAFT_1234755 [Coprinopsis sp. MPI-PUGE-AT-0042]